MSDRRVNKCLRKMPWFLSAVVFCLFVWIGVQLYTAEAQAEQKLELTMYMTVGEEADIPIYLNNGNFFYTADDLDVVKFLNPGKMTAMQPGTTIIMLSYIEDLHWVRTYYKVKVHDKVKKLRWKKKVSSLRIGRTATLKPVYKAGSRKNIDLVWKTSNSRVVSVNRKGKISGKKLGSAVITCSVKGQRGAVLKQKVKVMPVPVAEIRLKEKNVVIKEGESFDVNKLIEVLPKDATNTEVVIRSASREVAEVSEGIVQAKAPGFVEIEIVSKDSSKVTAELKVQVEPEFNVDRGRCVAHRGLSTAAPENTVKAFELAGQNGFYAVETDVWLTKDGQFVVHHDQNLWHSCGLNKLISEVDFDELRELKLIRGWNYEYYKNDICAVRIPTLEEYLNVCKTYEMVPQIEVKFLSGNSSLDSSNDLYRLYTEVKRIMGDAKVMFASSNYNTITNIHAVCTKSGEKDYRYFYILGKLDKISQIQHYAELQQKNIGFDVNCASREEVIKTLVKDGNDVDLWCVDDPKQAENFIKNYKVNLITTNFVLWN